MHREPPIKRFWHCFLDQRGTTKSTSDFVLVLNKVYLGLQTARWVTAGSALISGKTTAGLKEVTLAQSPWYHIPSCLPHHNFINYSMLEMLGWSQLTPNEFCHQGTVPSSLGQILSLLWAPEESLELMGKQVLFELPCFTCACCDWRMERHHV